MRSAASLFCACLFLIGFPHCQGNSVAPSGLLLSGSLTSSPQSAIGNGEASNGEGPVAVEVRCVPVGSSTLVTLFVARNTDTGQRVASFDLTENDQARTVPPFSVTRSDSSSAIVYQSASFLLQLTLPVTRSDGRYDAQLHTIVDGNQLDATLLCGIIPAGGISQ